MNAAERHSRPATSITRMLEGKPGTLAVTDVEGVAYEKEGHQGGCSPKRWQARTVDLLRAKG